MQLFVRDLQGHLVTMNAATADELRSQVAQQLGVPQDEQRLMYGRHQLEQGSLSAYGIDDNATVNLALRLRGGGPKKRCGCWITPTERCSQVSLRIVGDCSFCSTSFCGRHRLPEDHACPNLQNCKQEALDRLKTKLDSEKTVSEKVASF
ncbi:hypothetical protein OIO90_000617 [Microbotryomycetes sp. JL221]|nr:hypothetical protein OIO90_000617 [Microbotryomycetes sp. JL221]